MTEDLTVKREREMNCISDLGLPVVWLLLLTSFTCKQWNQPSKLTVSTTYFNLYRACNDHDLGLYPNHLPGYSFGAVNMYDIYQVA